MPASLPLLSSQAVRLRVAAFLLFGGYSWILLNGATRWSDVATTGSLLLISIAISFFIPHRKFCSWLWLVGALFLFILHGVNWLTGGSGIGTLLEHASQIGLPVLLFLLATGKSEKLITRFAFAILSFTFVFHGLFAVGLSSSIPWLNHATPDRFVFMTKACLGLESDTTALAILKVAGWLDFAAAAAIWFGPLRKAGLIYMLVWGFLTALARPVAYIELEFLSTGLMRWLPEFLIRTPHWAIPLALLAWPSFSCCQPAAKTETRNKTETAPS